MSRFKFRAWHPETKTMLYFGFKKGIRCLNGEPALDIPPKFVSEDPIALLEALSFYPLRGAQPRITLLNDPSLKIMQYLGPHCLDCDGIELCEGDIVKETMYENCEIVYAAGMFRLRSKWGSVYCVDDWFSYKKLGNRYENPDLLGD